MAYDPERKRHVLFGGAVVGAVVLGDTWSLYLRGGGCTDGSQCGSGFCTDGVCCETLSCGVCETCAGRSRGGCSPVANIEDPDTCACKDQKSCDAAGSYRPGLGAICKDGAGCATGFCAGGVCCDMACDGACRSCIASEKIDPTDGRCGPSKAGTLSGSCLTLSRSKA